MAQTTIEQFATELKMPAGALIEQLAAAGVDAKKTGDELTEQDKTRLLDYLRKQHGAAAEPKKRITLTRQQTTEIKTSDGSNKGRAARSRSKCARSACSSAAMRPMRFPRRKSPQHPSRKKSSSPPRRSSRRPHPSRSRRPRLRPPHPRPPALR